jgi:hypothetical protein
MRFGGWIFLVASWGAILSLFLYSLIRTLCSKDSNKTLDPARDKSEQ